MRLVSRAFEPGEAIPLKYAKSGENVSPPLSWDGVPKGTRSLALVVVDLHPVARGGVHWMIVDIPATEPGLAEAASGSATPAGAKELKPYMGPNPPSGSHDYEFRLYALATASLGLSGKTPLDAFSELAEKGRLGRATLVGKYTKIRK